MVFLKNDIFFVYIYICIWKDTGTSLQPKLNINTHAHTWRHLAFICLQLTRFWHRCWFIIFASFTSQGGGEMKDETFPSPSWQPFFLRLFCVSEFRRCEKVKIVEFWDKRQGCSETVSPSCICPNLFTYIDSFAFVAVGWYLWIEGKTNILLRRCW